MYFRPNQPHDPFGPLMEWAGGSRTAIPSDFRKHVDVLADLPLPTSNPVLRALLCDVCWLLCRKSPSRRISCPESSSRRFFGRDSTSRDRVVAAAGSRLPRSDVHQALRRTDRRDDKARDCHRVRGRNELSPSSETRDRLQPKWVIDFVRNPYGTGCAPMCLRLCALRFRPSFAYSNLSEGARVNASPC